MKDELHKIFNDIKNLRYIESYAVILIVIVILVLDIFGASFSQEIINDAFLAVLSVIVYVSILERRAYSEVQSRGEINGISIFNRGRDKLPPLGQHLLAAKHEIAILALAYNTIAHQYLGLLEQRVQSGCTIKIMMMAARDENGNLNPNVAEYESRWRYQRLLPALENNTKILSRWLASLDNETRQKVEIRTYREFPCGNYFFLDKDYIDGQVTVELTPSFFGFDINEVPHYVVIKRDNPDFFAFHVRSFENLWNRSKPLVSTEETG